MAAIHHLGFVEHILGIIHEEYLKVFITVQNLFGIAVAVLIIQKSEYFVHLAGKRLFTPLLGVFLGMKIRNGNFLHFIPLSL